MKAPAAAVLVEAPASTATAVVIKTRKRSNPPSRMAVGVTPETSDRLAPAERTVIIATKDGKPRKLTAAEKKAEATAAKEKARRAKRALDSDITPPPADSDAFPYYDHVRSVISDYVTATHDGMAESTPGLTCRTERLTPLLEKAMKDTGQTGSRVLRGPLLGTLVTDAALRLNVCRAQGHSSILAPRVTDFIVRMWYRERAHMERRRAQAELFNTDLSSVLVQPTCLTLHQEETLGTEYGEGGNRFRRRYARGDYLMRQVRGYAKPVQRPDATAFTYNSAFYSSTVKVYSRPDSRNYPKARPTLNVRESLEHTSYNRETRQLLLCACLSYVFAHRVPAHEVFEVLVKSGIGESHHTAPLMRQLTGLIGGVALTYESRDYALSVTSDGGRRAVHNIIDRDGGLTDTVFHPLSLDFDHGLPVVKAEWSINHRVKSIVEACLDKGMNMVRKGDHPSVFRPMALVWTEALVRAAMLIQGLTPHSHLNVMFSPNAVSVLRSRYMSGLTIQGSREGFAWHGVVHKRYGVRLPNGYIDPPEMTLIESAVEDAAGESELSMLTDEHKVPVVDLFKTINGDDMVTRRTNLTLKELAELHGLSAPAAKDWQDGLLTKLKDRGNLRVIEVDPSTRPGLLTAVFAYGSAKFEGLWVSSTCSEKPAVSGTMNLQWAAQSCMGSESRPEDAEAFYLHHTSCRLALAVDASGRVFGRALLWPDLLDNSNKPVEGTLMDRLYVMGNRGAEALYAHAKAKGYWFTHSGASAYPTRFDEDGNVRHAHSLLKVKLHAAFDANGEGGVRPPYLDTFHYGNIDSKGWLYLTQGTGGNIRFNATDFSNAFRATPMETAFAKLAFPAKTAADTAVLHAQDVVLSVAPYILKDGKWVRVQDAVSVAYTAEGAREMFAKLKEAGIVGAVRMPDCSTRLVNDKADGFRVIKATSDSHKDIYLPTDMFGEADTPECPYAVRIDGGWKTLHPKDRHAAACCPRNSSFYGDGKGWTLTARHFLKVKKLFAAAFADAKE